MPLTQVIGPRGSGKTFFLLIVMYFFSNRQIYSNFGLKLPEQYKKLSLITMLRLPKNIELLMDEAYNMIHSRISMSYVNIFAGFIAFELRKTDTNIMLTTILLRTIDVLYRDEWDYRVYCKRIPNGNLNWKKWDFEFTMVDFRTKEVAVWNVAYQNAIPLFALYDTYEIIKPRMMSRMEYEILKSDPALFYKMAEHIFDRIKSDIPKNPPVKKVKLALLKNNYDMIWSNVVSLFT